MTGYIETKTPLTDEQAARLKRAWLRRGNTPGKRIARLLRRAANRLDPPKSNPERIGRLLDRAWNHVVTVATAEGVTTYLNGEPITPTINAGTGPSPRLRAITDEEESA